MFNNQHHLANNIKPEVNYVVNNPEAAIESFDGSDRFLRLPEVMKLTALKRSSLYMKIQMGIFPEPVKIGVRAAAWRYRDVCRWRAAPMQYAERAAQS